MFTHVLRWIFLFLITALVVPGHAESVVISRVLTDPEPGKPEYLELYNNTSNPYDMARWQVTGAVTFTFPDLDPAQPDASFFRPFERIVLSSGEPSLTRSVYGIPEKVRVFGPWRGGMKNVARPTTDGRPKPEVRAGNKERIILGDKNGVLLGSVRFGRQGLWPETIPGSGQVMMLLDPDAGADDWRNWTIRPGQNNPPGTAPTLGVTSLAASPEVEANLGQILLDYGSTWRCNDSGKNPGARWRELAFDDANWRRGPGLLGFDSKTLPKPGLRTRLGLNGQTTYYFRTEFVWSADKATGAKLLLDQILDDGAVYYLNGKEVARSRMPAGEVQFTTLATSTVPTAAEELNVFALDPALLVSGTNVLAAEVHQSSRNSSDIVFGARLRLLAAAAPGLVINEIFPGPSGGFVELCNTATEPRNLKNCALSDSQGNLRQHVFAEDQIVSPGGVVAIGMTEAGISSGDPLTLFLSASDGQTVLNAVTVNFAQDGRALGRGPDGGKTWYRFATASRGVSNPKPGSSTPAGSLGATVSHPVADFRSDVVINEIMFDPPYRAENTEFVELFNRGSNAVDLSGWRFDQGINYRFPAGTEMAPGAYLVVAADLLRFRQAYGDLTVAGLFQGRLRGRGELLRLVDSSGQAADAVDFRVGGDWPLLAHGGGSSLELINPWMDRNRSSAWHDSREESKSAWRTYACTNSYRESNRMGEPTDFRELHVYLVGEGHVALRNVGLFKDGVNYLDKPERMSRLGDSAYGWLAQGTHAASFMTNGELHVVSDGRGDNRADRVEIDCVRLKGGEKYELRFEARWISGCPRLIAHTWDRSIGGSFLLELPANLGTPGRANSVTAQGPLTPSQAPPQLDDLQHSPAVPRSSDPVQIRVHVSCAGALAGVRLRHRADSADGNGAWATTLMHPLDEPGAPASGVYAAELTDYQANERVVQFYVEASAANGLQTTLPRGGAERPALYVVDDRNIARDGRLDRFVISAYDLGSIREGETPKYGFRQPQLSNHRYNMTFISNEEKVFYGGSIRVSGSPFTRGRDLGKAKWELPPDRPFRGRTKFYYDNDSNFHNRICRYLLYQIGHVANDAEWVHVIINTSGPFLKEDTEPVTGEFLSRVFPNGGNGELYRFDDEWWFTDEWDRNNRDADWSYRGTDDPLPYRTQWQKHTREVEDNYSALIAFFKAYSTKGYSQEDIAKYLDVHAVLQMAAVRGYIGDWDSFTMFRGKNGYFYRHPKDGKFQFLQWDSDLAFRDGGYPFYSDRVASWLEKPYNFPEFKKNLQQLAQFTESPQFQAWLQEEAAATPQRPVEADTYRRFFRERNRYLRATVGNLRRR